MAAWHLSGGLDQRVPIRKLEAVLNPPSLFQQHRVCNYGIPCQKIANLGANFVASCGLFPHRVDVELSEHLEADAPSPALPQLRAPVSCGLLFLGIRLI